MKLKLIHTYIYTDASKTGEGKVGIGIVIWDGETYKKIPCFIDEENSVFRGEALAIQRAVRLVHINQWKEVTIYSDSFSSLQALQNLDNQDPTILHTQNYALDTDVAFKWIPAHVGIEGNEIADQTAKEGASSQMALKLNFDPPNTNKKEMKRRTMEMWQDSWNLSEKGRYTFEKFETVTADGFDLHKEFLKWEKTLINRALSNHIPTNSYLLRFGLNDDDKCNYCDQSETIEHLLLECSKFAVTRYMHENRREGASPLTRNNLFHAENLKFSLDVLKVRFGQH